MFSYYGTKKKLSPFYPTPNYDTIIEPFAGAAMYSLYGNNWERDVILYDKYDKVFLAWDFLIKATITDIKNLPELKQGLNLNTLNLSDEEKSLLGFYCNPASAVPKLTVTARGEKSWERNKNYLISNIYKVHHWKIYNKSFVNIKNIDATWFIDPPYQFGGQYYHSSTNNTHINYAFLASWSLNRKGEIIVCENDKANWLDFIPLAKLNGQLHQTMEVIFYSKTNN